MLADSTIADCYFFRQDISDHIKDDQEAGSKLPTDKPTILISMIIYEHASSVFNTSLIFASSPQNSGQSPCKLVLGIRKLTIVKPWRHMFWRNKCEPTF